MYHRTWFGPIDARGDVWKVPAPSDDQSFNAMLPQIALLSGGRSDVPLEIVCEDASRLSANAMDAFRLPFPETTALRIRSLRMSHYELLGSATFATIAAVMPNIEQIEILDGAPLDAACITSLATMPKLHSLAIDKLAAQTYGESLALLEQLGACKKLSWLALLGCYLLQHEIDTVIAACGLEELAVACQYDDEAQRAIQEDHPGCIIHWC
jgi:hypothetical protein